MLDYTESHGWFLYTLIRNCPRTTYTKYYKEYQIDILIKMFDSMVDHFKYFFLANTSWEAIAVAPRGKRAMELLNITVGVFDAL